MNIKLGAVQNKFERLRNQYSTSVGVTQGASLNQFGYTGPSTLNTFDITPYASVVPVNFGEFFDADPGYTRWAVADLGAFNQLFDPATLDAAASLDYQNSGTFDEKSTAALPRVQQEARARRPWLALQCRPALGEDRAGSHRLRADRGDADGPCDAGDQSAVEHP